MSYVTFTSLFALIDSRTSEKVWHNKLDSDFQAHDSADTKTVS